MVARAVLSSNLDPQARDRERSYLAWCKSLETSKLTHNDTHSQTRPTVPSSANQMFKHISLGDQSHSNHKPPQVAF